jgi:hypothetical protein
MLHNQGFERELCERVCHLLVTYPFEEKKGGSDERRRQMFNNSCKSTAEIQYEVTFWKIAL